MDKKLKQLLKHTNSLEELVNLVKQVDFSEIKSTEISLIDKSIKKLSQKPEFKIAYLGNYTIEPLPSYVNAFSVSEGIIAEEYIGSYQQYFQELLNPNSPLINYNPDLIYLDISLRELQPKIYYEYSSLSLDERKNSLNFIISHISDWLKVALNQTSANILISNFLQPNFYQTGIADLNQEYGESEFYLELNLALLCLLKKESRVHLFDIERLASRFGKEQVHNPKMYYIAKMEWRENFLPTIARELIRYIKAIKGYTKKCLVLDLDNTLWGGVVGEEGVMGIKIGQGDPVSEAFLEFQRKIKTVKDRGILLAICSKNNINDALEAFEKRPEMPLKKSDFSAMEINWEPKHKNLQKIASTLNIGTDSLVFIDDNPAECSLVTQMMPEVKTILLPSDPATYSELLEQLNEFEKVQILQDDLSKATQYIQNKQREEHKQQIGDMASYLESLGTEIKIWEATEEDLPRVHQLFSKTNQFNLTTIRYSMAEVEKFFQDSNYDLTVISAHDNFGEIGTIALYLLDLREKPYLLIDSLIMSCRAMGRGIETAIVNHLKTKYLTNHPEIQLSATYIPTKKNKPVVDFFEQQGFEVVKKEETGTKKYILKSESAKLIDSSWIKIIA
ncbi:HAD family hydrolase [Okeania sp. SIO2B3]|uniref:HAD-IIIC family phosphatase n=1 Tax=Okeania sp. SIO2B3 TaxID=2607784 RepID=UPI0013BF0E8A|nr:HAD-IIIC family phosphatase [Okeania sp. SIO2B3]NET43248.1 HAD-IIIC family phosphatase [Okeania sp. SIO2B3]